MIDGNKCKIELKSFRKKLSAAPGTEASQRDQPPESFSFSQRQKSLPPLGANVIKLFTDVVYACS
jgi:hypothetical protein